MLDKKDTDNKTSTAAKTYDVTNKFYKIIKLCFKL